MQKALRIRLLFYNNFSLATNAISIFGGYLILQFGTMAFVMPVLCMKLVTNGLIGLMFHFFKQNQLYFFQNLGVSVTQLYLFSFLMDMILWLGFTIITSFIL